jgi:hypothetical protein
LKWQALGTWVALFASVGAIGVATVQNDIGLTANQIEILRDYREQTEAYIKEQEQTLDNVTWWYDGESLIVVNRGPLPIHYVTTIQDSHDTSKGILGMLAKVLGPCMQLTRRQAPLKNQDVLLFIRNDGSWIVPNIGSPIRSAATVEMVEKMSEVYEKNGLDPKVKTVSIQGCT